MTTEKTILIIAGIITGMLLIIAGGVYGDSQNFSQPVTLPEKPVSIEGKQGKCGDGICDAKEKQNPRVCPQDCKPADNDDATETCGQDNQGYCVDFREKCKTGYEDIGPDSCYRGRSAACCVPIESSTKTEQTCSELGGTICSSAQTCSGSWLDASDSEKCCGWECAQVNNFISGFKIDNLENSKEVSEYHFQMAQEIGLDYILVPVTNKDSNQDSTGKIDWSKGMDYPYLFELSKQYEVDIFPQFFKAGGQNDKIPEKYAEFVMSFLDEFYEENEITYIEFQNEPLRGYDPKIGKSHGFAGTPTDLRKSNNLAYEQIKEKYPDIIIGTAGLLTSSVGSNDENVLYNDYYEEYFNFNNKYDGDKLKFDFLALHNYQKTSSILQTHKTGYLSDTYNFMSEAEIFETYRKLLNDYGYADKSIFITEVGPNMPFKTSEKNSWDWVDDNEVAILLMERFVFTLSNKEDKNIIGLMMGELQGKNNRALFNYNIKSGEFRKTNKFYFYKMLLKFTREYPYYSKHIAGEIDSDHYWVAEFEDEYGKKMWMAFCPFLFWAEAQVDGDRISAVATEKSIVFPQDVTFEVGDNIKSVKISTLFDSWVVEVVNGKVNFSLGKEPVFVEQVEPTEQTCSDLGGTICSLSQTCLGSWLDASDSARCCSGECETSTTGHDTSTLDYEDSPFGFIPGEVVYGQRPKATFLADLGVHWNKGAPKNPIQFPSKDINDIDFSAEVDFTNLDEYVKEIVIDNGIHISLPLLIFVGINNEKILLTHDQYRELNTVLIERYNGDGVNDMDGSPKVKYWFVGASEMNTGIGKGQDINTRKWKLSEADTAEYVKIGYDLIKSFDSEFKVLLGGSNSICTWQKDTPCIWREKSEPDEFYYNLISEMTGDNFCPDMIFDYHHGSNPTQFKSQIEAMNIVKETLSKFGYANNDIWTTDVGGSWDGRGGFTEIEQAGDVVRRYAYTIANGQEKLYWTRVEEYHWTDDSSSIFDYMGLINNPINIDGKDWKKLSYYTYKLMVEKLEGSDWDNIETIQESDKVYIYKFMKNGEPVWVAWWDYFDDIGNSKTITIDIGNINSVKITEAVPKYETGQEVTDYSTAFNVETKTASGGKITITLGESPVFVEEN